MCILICLSMKKYYDCHWDAFFFSSGADIRRHSARAKLKFTESSTASSIQLLLILIKIFPNCQFSCRDSKNFLLVFDHCIVSPSKCFFLFFGLNSSLFQCHSYFNCHVSILESKQFRWFVISPTWSIFFLINFAVYTQLIKIAETDMI